MRRDCVKICCLVCILYVISFLGFSAPVMAEDLPLTVDLFPVNNSRDGNPVTLTLKGKKYSGGWFDQILNSGGATPDETFVINSISKYKKGSMTDIRNLWVPDEQAGISKRFSDKRFYANSQAYFRRLTRAKFLCKIFYGNYIIFVVQHEIEGHGSNIRNHALKKVDGKYYFTNKLNSDPVFLYWSRTFAENINKSGK